MLRCSSSLPYTAYCPSQKITLSKQAFPRPQPHTYLLAYSLPASLAYKSSQVFYTGTSLPTWWTVITLTTRRRAQTVRRWKSIITRTTAVFLLSNSLMLPRTKTRRYCLNRQATTRRSQGHRQSRHTVLVIRARRPVLQRLHLVENHHICPRA